MRGQKKKSKIVYNNPISHIIFFMPWNQLDKGVEGKSYFEGYNHGAKMGRQNNNEFCYE